MIRPIDDGLIAAFNDPAAGARTALDLTATSLNPSIEGESSRQFMLRVAVHAGPVLAATTQDHLDYFGASVRQFTSGLLPLTKGGEVILSQAVMSDLAVAGFLAERRIEGRIVPDIEALLDGVPIIIG